jgi:hypothetical protein
LLPSPTPECRKRFSHRVLLLTNLQLTYFGELLFVWSISCTKISILLFYRRLAAGSATKAFLWGTWIGVGYNVAYFITYTILPANMCRPADAYWNQFNLFYKKEWSCIDEGMVLPVGAALSVVSDLYGCLLPVLLLRKLQMLRRQKVLLYCLFALGFFVVVSGVVRTYYLVYLFHYTYDVTCKLHNRAANHLYSLAVLTSTPKGTSTTCSSGSSSKYT